MITQFSSQEKCIMYLEKARWGDKPECPHCESSRVNRKLDLERVGRWHCKSCKASYNVLQGTLFQKTGIPLPKWFAAINLIMNAKKSISSYQLARDLGMKQRSAYNMAKKIREEMSRKDKILLKGVIEADETYVGGKPRRRRDKDGNLPPPPKRGRGTKKTPVIGAIERGGQVVARVATDLTSKGVVGFIKEVVNPEGSVLMTDEFKSYSAVDDWILHKVVNHKRKQYVTGENGEIHTNTIEGFWSIVKRAFHGTHHHYKHIRLYIAEACYKWNNRDNPNVFEKFIRECFT